MASTGIYSMDLFFYIKNSSDYPPGQILTDKFGYETTTSADGTSTETTAVFNYTMKDIYNKLTTPKVVENLYQLNKIDNNVPVISTNPIATSSTEYNSVMVIDDGKQSIYNDINPDYNYTETYLNNITNNKIDRSNVFWRKMFSLFEYLKYNESNIINKALPNIDENLLRTDDPDTKTLYNAESVVGKYIMAFIANKNQFVSQETASNDIYNDYRKTYFNPIYGSNGDWSDTDNNIDKLWQTIGIIYSTKSGSIVTSAKYSDRIDKITFTVQYYNPSSEMSNSAGNQIWTFNLYFTPDAIIENKAESRYKVWTYNDTDLDDQYSDTSGNFNPLDNDYANVLSKDATINKSFVVNKSEMTSQITKKIVDICKDGLYSGYVEFKTTRISPYIEAGSTDGTTKAHVVWDENNKTVQTFYIFYTSTEPSSSEQQSAVQTYLRDLHSDCHSQTTDDDGNVIYIGHGTTNEELSIFLSKMYPELFSLSTVTIVPVANYRETDAYAPSMYIHPVSLPDIVNTIKAIPGFTNFGFNTDGSYQDLDDNSRAGVEVFYLGGPLESDKTITYDFPVLCTRAGSSSAHPFRDIDGMNAYKQQLYEGNNVPEKTSDLLQFILIKLFQKMFVKGVDATKKNIGQIGDVIISYSYESGYDPNNDLMGYNVANVANFTINGISYTVYPHQGKNFGSLTSSETIGA